MIELIRVIDPTGIFPDEERLACAKCGLRPTAWGDALCTACQAEDAEDHDTMRDLLAGPQACAGPPRTTRRTPPPPSTWHITPPRMGSRAGGDARVALNLLEQMVLLLVGESHDEAQPVELTRDIVETVAVEKLQSYDKKGDNHFDVTSAFIKSMRGSDPDAALHNLARMIEGGEDPRFIARRMVICAAEDVGNADPVALMLAVSASFAGPMLARCNGESGGIHYVGDSSTGKTTAIEVACATWVVE